MSEWNCVRGFKCTTLALIASIILGFVAAIIGVPLFVVKSAGVAINRLIN